MSVSVGAVMPEPKPAMTGEAVATGAMKRRNDTDLIVEARCAPPVALDRTR